MYIYIYIYIYIEREREREKIVFVLVATYYISLEAYGVMVILWEMNTTTQVQFLNEVVCISHIANILGKVIYLTILPSAMGKW